MQLLLGLALFIACGGGSDSTLEPDEFIDVYVELRRAAIADSAGFPRTRDSILAAHAVEVEDLERFIAEAEPRTLSEAWTEIAGRLEPMDSIPADSALKAQEPAG